MNNEKLFDAFAATDKATWRKKIEGDLRGADYDQTLRTKTEDGLEVEGYYHPEEKQQWQLVEETLKNESLNTEQPALGARHWYNQVPIFVSQEAEANKQALDALQNGADALLLDLSECHAPNFETLFNGIHLQHCRVSLQASQTPDPITILKNFLEYVSKHQENPQALRGSFIGLPVSALLLATEQAKDFPAFRFFVPEGLKDQTPARQIAGFLRQLTEAAEVLSPAEVWKRTEWYTGCTHDYFGEIARLRATRFLLIQLAKIYELPEAKSLPLHAYTLHAGVSLPEADTHFLIRNTTQAMAAILGGAAAITVIPHEKERTFAARIARNVSNMLQEEAYLEKVADPAAGAYYIEKRTDLLARAAWEAFQQMI